MIGRVERKLRVRWWGSAAPARASRAVGVGRDVGAPEAVDRLLGIADQIDRPADAVVEDGPEDLPLHLVGVLELVDDRQQVAVPQRRDQVRRRAGPRQRLGDQRPACRRSRRGRPRASAPRAAQRSAGRTAAPPPLRAGSPPRRARRRSAETSRPSAPELVDQKGEQILSFPTSSATRNRAGVAVSVEGSRSPGGADASARGDGLGRRACSPAQAASSLGRREARRGGRRRRRGARDRTAIPTGAQLLRPVEQLLQALDGRRTAAGQVGLEVRRVRRIDGQLLTQHLGERRREGRPALDALLEEEGGRPRTPARSARAGRRRGWSRSTPRRAPGRRRRAGSRAAVVDRPGVAVRARRRRSARSRTVWMRAPMRRRSSAAARSVKVTTSISSRRASPRTRRSTTRCSMRKVLPVPADASMTAERSRGIRASSSGSG